MRLSINILNRHGACADGVEWYSANGSPNTVEKTVAALLQSGNTNRHQWSNWLLSGMLSPNNKIRYAIYAAEQVIEIFEKRYPNDKRPKNAIDAAIDYLKKPSAAAWAAAWAAAGAAVGAAGVAVGAAARAAWAAARAAWAAAGAAGVAAEDAAEDATYEKIIKYGVLLVKKEG